MKQLANMRKADGRLGDDTTFTRWIAEPMRHAATNRKTPAVSKTMRGTKFPTRRIRVENMRDLLVSGHSNVKIGRDVRVGKLKGYWLYTLSLEERATCPSSCFHWMTCYGNSMPFAKRIVHDDPKFLPSLEANIQRLVNVRGRRGIIIRLHALGDFYDVSYVNFWREMLARFPRLVVFGYTAWSPSSPVGAAIDALIDHFPGRAMIRFSNGGLANRSTIPIARAEDCPSGAFVCPEQTEQFDACGKCGACWSTLKNVAFLEH